MFKKGFLLIFFIVPLAVYSQINDKPVINKKALLEQKSNLNDSLRPSSDFSSKKSIKPEALITDYKIISFTNDTTFVDTTLTIQKEYKYNYLRKDNFNLISFSNIGQTYNTLSIDFMSTKMMPSFGSQAKHFNFMELEDIDYYYVPTPLTDLMYKTAFEQGQLLDAFFTVNTSKQLNLSIAYKGLRSLGKYQHILTSTGNFRFTTNYKTKNDKYNFRGHVVFQDILNQENGGLRDEDLVNFESGAEDFLDRSIFDVNFENAENILLGKRFHLDHNYALIKQNDSLVKNELTLHNSITISDKEYEYEQTSANDYFGDSFESSSLRDKVTLDELFASVGATYSNNTIGNLGISISNSNYNYGYNSLVVLNESSITNRLKGNILGFTANYKKAFKNFDLEGALGSNISGDFSGNFLSAKLKYDFNEFNNILVQVNSNSKAPNYNFLLHQSDYINYNWQNDFNNIKTNQFSLKFNSDKFLNLEVDFTSIDDYVYFKQIEIDDVESIKPFQNSGTITYLRVKANREFKYKNFALENTIMYQNVNDDEQSLNVPEFITRNTLYYSNHLFKKALYLQTGIIFNYFTKFNMNGYDPLLSEFYTQNETELGDFPRLDFFINAKVKQTRIYLKAEHFNSAWTGYNYYSAPNYPYRDFIVRFGLVWNFFL